MKILNSTEARQNFSPAIPELKNSSITSSNHNQELALIFGSARYKELKKLDDIVSVENAEQAIKEGFVSNKAAKYLLDKL